MSRAELMRRPERLTGEAASIWDSIASDAVKDGRLNEGTRETFTVYCELKATGNALEHVVNTVPTEFSDPLGEMVAHPLQGVLADVLEAALEIEKAIGVGRFGSIAMRARDGELGGLREARFNRIDPRDAWDLMGPQLVDGDDEGSE